jgi:predicted GIY-YIG superfamily endonuclease
MINHNSGKGAKYTKSRRPVELIGISSEMTKSDALKLEYRIKQFPADKKLSELTGKENGMTLKQDLKGLQKEIKALEKKLATLTKAVEKSEKSNPAKKSRAKSVKIKAAAAGSVKKAPVKRISSKLTATDHVLKVIKGSKKGVDTATLMNKKTGI